MIHKVIVHHPARGTLAEHTYRDRSEAEDARDRLQMEHHRSPGVSVVLLGAETEEAMRYTHGRYWPLVALLALLQGCGPAWPPGWGDPCAAGPCPTGTVCYLSQTRHESTGDRSRAEVCQPSCSDCPPGWECMGTVCRLPCGPGVAECPRGGACALSVGGCEPS